MRVALIVPIKSFSNAKARLEDVLSATERDRLARWSAERTVNSFVGTDIDHEVLVVCEDTDVQKWCHDNQISFVVPMEPGLDAAATSGVAEALKRGVDMIVVAHADLAHPEELPELAHNRCVEFITLVPDLDFNGTNVIAMPASVASEFEFMYGPGSFARHAEIAESIADTSEVMLHVVDDSLLSIDIDTADDLMIPSVRAILPFEFREPA